MFFLKLLGPKFNVEKAASYWLQPVRAAESFVRCAKTPFVLCAGLVTQVQLMSACNLHMCLPSCLYCVGKCSTVYMSVQAS